MHFTRGTIVAKKIWADGLFTISVQAPEVQPFEPGQYLQVGVQRPDKHMHHPYSVASPHGEILDFFIVRVDDGRLTPTLWSLTVGDAVDVSTKATGSFTLSHIEGGENLWLIGTGTGLAPYIAMLRCPSTWRRFQRVQVVHGVRHGRDLAYQDELMGYQEKYGERFHWLPVVSREHVEGALQGRITDCLTNGCLENAAGNKISTEHSTVMMCGNPAMLNDLQAILLERGMKKHTHKEMGNLIVERYW